MKERITAILCFFGVLLYLVAGYFGGKYTPLLLPASCEQPIIVFLCRVAGALAGILLVGVMNNFIRLKLGCGD